MMFPLLFIAKQKALTQKYLLLKKTNAYIRTLGDVEELLPPEIFQRIHHSTLVNISFISQFLRTDGGYVVLKNGEKLSVSKAKRKC